MNIRRNYGRKGHQRWTLSRAFSGSTILEVVVSMVLITVVFALAMGIFSGVQRLAVSAKKMEVEALLQADLIQAEQARDTLSTEYQRQGYKIVRTWSPYPDRPRVMILWIKGFDTSSIPVAEIKIVEYE